MSLDEILIEESNPYQTTKVYKNGKLIEADVLSVMEIDDKEYALCIYQDPNNKDANCLESFYVLQDKDGYDYLMEIDDPVDEYKTEKWLIDYLEEGETECAEDILAGGPIEPIRFKLTRSYDYHEPQFAFTEGFRSAGYFYDKGMSEYENGYYGDAILNLEKAYAKGRKDVLSTIKNIHYERQESAFYHKIKNQADNGQRDSQYKIGLMYEFGTFVDKNSREASSWFYKAAKQGHVDAMYMLGKYCYENRDDYAYYSADAYYWLRKANTIGHPRAKTTFTRLINTDMSMVTNYDAWDLYYKSYEIGESNKKQSFEYCLRAANAGCVPAMDALGNCYYNGYGCKQDYTFMSQWYEKAANLGNTDSMCSLASCYMYGYGVVRNENLAEEWARKAFQKQNLRANVLLGELYLWGENKNPSKAAEFLYPAAIKGDSAAWFDLGWAIHDGASVPYGTCSEKSCFKKAANLGNPNAKIMLLGRETGMYYNLIYTIGPVVKCLADDEFVTRDRGQIYVEAVDSSGSIYTNQFTHFSVYAWLFDVDDDTDARIYRSLLTYHKPYIENGLKLTSLYYPTSSIFDHPDQYRLSYKELIPMVEYYSGEGGLAAVFRTLAEGLQLYLGDEYTVTPDKKRVSVKKK